MGGTHYYFYHFAQINHLTSVCLIPSKDIESIPNIEQVAHSKVVDDDNLWCPKLGYAPLDKYIWKRFLRGDELFINQRLKIIPKMVEGGWYFTFPQRPSIIGYCFCTY